MTLAERLTTAMSYAGINQAELARACGVKPPSVSGWLSGKAKFLRGENLLSAARALGVSQDWLATNRGPMRIDKADALAALPNVPLLRAPAVRAPTTTHDGTPIMLNVTFIDGTGPQPAAALDFACSGRPAQHDPHRAEGGTTWHIVSFKPTAEQASDALILLRYTGTGDNVIVRCGGRVIGDADNVRDILTCYTRASALNNSDEYCRRTVRPVGTNESHEIPCTRIADAARDPEFWRGSETEITQRLCAAAVRAECEWCPLFQQSRITK